MTYLWAAIFLCVFTFLVSYSELRDLFLSNDVSQERGIQENHLVNWWVTEMVEKKFYMEREVGGDRFEGFQPASQPPPPCKKKPAFRSSETYYAFMFPTSRLPASSFYFLHLKMFRLPSRRVAVSYFLLLLRGPEPSVLEKVIILQVLAVYSIQSQETAKHQPPTSAFSLGPRWGRAPEVRRNRWAFSGGPVVRTPSFHCRGHRFDPQLGN